MQTQIQGLEQAMQGVLQKGEEPSKEQAEEYEGVVTRLQSNGSYQKLVAAQANFDKIVGKVKTWETCEKVGPWRMIVSVGTGGETPKVCTVKVHW